MPRSIEEIKADIANVQAEIAQRKSYEQPRTRVGWASYIIDNDRGMLDKYADAERAYNNMLMQQEHAKAMQQEQLNNAKELAELQRQEQSVYNADEWQKNYELASAEYDAALADYTVDQNDPLKKARLRKAATNMNYWGAKRGYEAVNPFELVKEADKNTTNAIDIADMDAYISGKKKFTTIKEHQDLISKAKADPAYNADANYRDKVNGLESIKSIEAIKKEDEVNKAKWRNEYNALSPLMQRKWKKANPAKAKAIGV